MLGAPYQAGGVWYYPRESYEGQETGLATVYPSGHAELTADGEVFDQTALAAAHQTLQLPAIARLTNLENGRQVLVRINDRGPATPHRLIEVTRRTATLLRLPGRRRGARAAGGAAGGKPRGGRCGAGRAEAGARRGAASATVQQSDLPPPGSAAPATPRRPTPVAAAPAAPAAAPITAAAGDGDAGAARSRQLVRPTRHVPELSNTPTSSARGSPGSARDIVSTRKGGRRRIG